jgi:hypothetical protein
LAQPVAKWTNATVTVWLQSVDLEEYVDKFTKGKVTGAMLLQIDDTMAKMLISDVLHAMAFMLALKELKERQDLLRPASSSAAPSDVHSSLSPTESTNLPPPVLAAGAAAAAAAAASTSVIVLFYLALFETCISSKHEFSRSDVNYDKTDQSCDFSPTFILHMYMHHPLAHQTH